MELEKMELSRLYRVLGWPTNPDDPAAYERFRSIEGFARHLVRGGSLGSLEARDSVRILDVMAASGIAGVAFAKALASRGVKVKLLVTDLRVEELLLAEKWARVVGIGGDRVSISYARVDATRIPEDLGGRGFDLIICWGSSMPHLDVYGLVLFLAGAREVQAPGGILVIQQADLLPPILINNSFRRILVEGEVLTVFKEYDTRRGVQRRLAYKLPQLEYLGITESRLWEASQIAAVARIFYKNIEVLDYIEPVLGRNTKVIVASNPRENTPSWRELARIPP